MTACRDCACGCCSGIHRETSLEIANRPGLSAIAYRSGTWATFRASMTAALSGTANALSGRLTTRDDDDFSIGLIDAWATTLDVLTFYQERVANEAYLRTAQERLSLVELARLIGYELAPAVSAETSLAFTIDGEATSENVIIDAGTRVQSVPGQNEQPQTFETTEELKAHADWNLLTARATETHTPASGETSAYFNGTKTNLKINDPIVVSHSGGAQLVFATKVDEDFDKDRTRVWFRPALTGNNGSFRPVRAVTNFFGYNAPHRAVLPTDQAKYIPPSGKGINNDWNFPGTPATSRLTDSNNPLIGIISTAEQKAMSVSDFFGGGAKSPPTTYTFDLDGAHPEIRAGDVLFFTAPGVVSESIPVDSATETALSLYALSGKATQIETTQSVANFQSSKYRRTVIYAAGDALEITERPRTAAIGGTAIELNARIRPFEGERQVIVRGTASGEPLAVRATVGSVTENGGRSTLVFNAEIPSFSPDSPVEIFGNVAAANHGETVKQSIGSGDAAQSFQTFPLSRPPLTYVSSTESPRGSAAALSVYVNELRWKEAETLFGRSPRERIYKISRDSDEKASVVFGDGRDAGPRLPTGHDNVRAEYRTGAGTAGNVRTGQLTLLMTPPYAVKDVQNPVAATGGTDAELMTDARRNAPKTMLTIDRVVSLRDYEAFAASYKGLGKALATWTWLGTSRELVVSIAGATGDPIAPDDPLRGRLLESLRKFGRPHIPIRIESFTPVRFQIEARVKIDDDHVEEVVLGDIRTALEKAFSFEARTFGQAVNLSEVVQVIQNVAGVVFVDVNALYRSTDSSALSTRLVAAQPRVLDGGSVQAAEIITLDDWATQDVRSMEAV